MNNEYLYDLYRIAFLSVKQKCTNGVLNAAKPALLVAVIDAIEDGVVRNNQIRYIDIRERYIKELAEWQSEKTPLNYPFYFMERDGFWHLKWIGIEPEKKAAPSEKFIRDSIDYAYFDNALWDILQDEEARKGYRQAITTYFNKAK